MAVGRIVATPPSIGFAVAGAVTVSPPTPLIETPGAFVVSPEQLIDWVIEVEEGERCVYARAATLNYHRALRERAQRLAAQGSVTLALQRFAADSGLFDYIARRTCLPVAADAPPPPRSDDALSSEARRVIELLVRYADQGAPCPSNRAIARACGLKDADASAYQVRRLAELGFILRKATPVEPGRQITIVETGARTGLIGR